MDKKKETKWNSDLFSENTDMSANTKEGFHTIHTKQKLKNIKKNKKVKFDNFKNIETFDTLDNTKQEGFNDNSKCQDNPGDPDCKGWVPGLMDDTTCPDPDYEGCDSGDAGRNEDDPRKRLIAFIERIYRWFDFWFFFMAFVVALALGNTSKTIQNTVNKNHRRLKTKDSNNTRTKINNTYKSILNFDVSNYIEVPQIKDVQLIKKYIQWVGAILISCYTVYHLFFLFYYKHVLYYKEGVELADISTKKIREDAKLSTYSVQSLFLFFFQFAWWFVESLEYYFEAYYIKYTSIYLNATLCFILLFVFLIWFFYYYPGILKTFLFDLLNMNMNNKYAHIMYAIVILLAIMDWFNIFNYLPGGPIYYSYLILIIFRFIIILFISLPFAGIFLLFYVLIYSLFGIFLYGRVEMSFLAVFKDVSKYAEDTKNQIRIGTDCSPNTFFEKIMITINVIMDFIYTYVFYIAFIVIFLFSFYDYSVNISSVPLKNGLLVITAILIAMLSSFCINSFRLRAKGKFAAHSAT